MTKSSLSSAFNLTQPEYVNVKLNAYQQISDDRKRKRRSALSKTKKKMYVHQVLFLNWRPIFQ